MKIVLVLIALAACQREREVALKLGPADGTLSVGFRCRQQADPTKLLIQRARIRNGNLVVTMVVDLIDLGGRVLGCRGEEIITACDPALGGECLVSVASNPTRYCKELEIPIAGGNAADIAASFLEIASGAVITSDAPSNPVIIRAVATTEDCSTIQQSSDGVTYDLLDPSLAVGCAYSCPVRLDEIDGDVYLSLDVLDENCEPAVLQCAGRL